MNRLHDWRLDDKKQRKEKRDNQRLDGPDFSNFNIILMLRKEI